MIAWLRGGGGRCRDFRKAIAATRASKVFAVGQEGFTRVQGDLFCCPVDLISDAVRDEELPFAWQSNGASGANLKIGIVRGDNRILTNRGAQFFWGFHTTRDDRVGINRAG